MRGFQHFSKHCREGGNLRDAKVNTQTMTPGLAQVSFSEICLNFLVHPNTGYSGFY